MVGVLLRRVDLFELLGGYGYRDVDVGVVLLYFLGVLRRLFIVLMFYLGHTLEEPCSDNIYK